MKILIIGCGIIGSIYGWALSEAKHDITHLVRKNKLKNLSNGIDLDIYDLRGDGELGVADKLTMSLLNASGRGSTAEEKLKSLGSKHHYDKEKLTTYHPKLIAELTSHNDFELVIVATKHTQLISTLKDIYPNLKQTKFLIFCANWDGLEAIDMVIPREQYLLGYPASSGGYEENGKMVVNIRYDYRIGDIDGAHEELLKTIIILFASADFVPDIKSNILEWLWVHHAINGGTIGSLIYAGGFDAITQNNSDFANLFYGATLEAIEVLKKRGIPVEKYPEVEAFVKQTPVQVLECYRKLFIETAIGQRTMRAGHHKHSANEMKQYYMDVLTTGKKLGVPMPILASYEKQINEHVEATLQ